MFRTVNKVKCLNERRWYVLADVIIFVYEVPCIFCRYINVDEVSLITLKSYYKVRWNYYKLWQLSLLQGAVDSYYKLRQPFYYKVRHGLLQIATGITKWDDYYKLWQVLQSAMDLLQSATGITKCDDYYKLRQYNVPQKCLDWLDNKG